MESPTTNSPPLTFSTKKSLNTLVPVVAMGSGLTLNGVLRILGRARLPVYCVCPSDDFVLYSRWYREPPLPGVSGLKPFELERFLRSLSWEEAVLMPCSDDWVRASTSLPPALARRFPASMPARDVVLSMLDKWKFAQLLLRTGTPHPQTLLLQSHEDLQNLPESYFGNQIFKPESSVEFAAKHGVKGYLVHSRTQALEIAPKLDYPIMLQEYIPGPPTESYFVDGFVDRHGRVCARFARQRIRMHPRDLGNSSLTISISLEQIRDAVASLDQLLARVNYRGIFSAEFKHDSRDGLFKLLEVNARPWWYIEFAARCGVDVCSMAYADALGAFVPAVEHYQIGRSCTFLPYDIYAYRALHGENGLHFWSWIHSWSGGDDALFSWDDIGPGVAFTRDVGRIALRRAALWTKAA
jgi:D-aspartate ligase